MAREIRLLSVVGAARRRFHCRVMGPRFPGRSIDTTLSLGETRRGSVRREFVPRAASAGAADGRAPGDRSKIIDVLSLKLFDPEDSFDQEFEYVDLSEHASGDYFYVRVTQIDGELAWSSPWWVGERSKR